MLIIELLVFGMRPGRLDQKVALKYEVRSYQIRGTKYEGRSLMWRSRSELTRVEAQNGGGGQG